MTKFQRYDLGRQVAGTPVIVTLQGSTANVRLMDALNFERYRNGQAHRYHGGLAERSPVRLIVPSAGHWYVTVDLQGLRAGAHVRWAVRVEASLPGVG